VTFCMNNIGLSLGPFYILPEKSSLLAAGEMRPLYVWRAKQLLDEQERNWNNEGMMPISNLSKT